MLQNQTQFHKMANKYKFSKFKQTQICTNYTFIQQISMKKNL